MQRRSPSPSMDSAERIYDMLCAAQLKANAAEEEIKVIHLRTANAEAEIQANLEAMRDLKLQCEQVLREVSAKRGALEEQKHRLAGAAETLTDSQKALAEANENILSSTLPAHTAVSDAANCPESLCSIMPPVKLREISLNLKRKLDEASKRHLLDRKQEEREGSDGEAGHRSPSGGVGQRRPLVVCFRKTRAAVPHAESEAQPNVDEEGAAVCESPGRKCITFDDDQLEVDSSAYRHSTVTVTIPRHPAPSSHIITITKPHPPRRTMWRGGSCKTT